MLFQILGDKIPCHFLKMWVCVLLHLSFHMFFKKNIEFYNFICSLKFILFVHLNRIIFKKKISKKI